ncbi:hypothetical protein GCM10018955_28080 [Planomonospora venezuelensis]
MPLADHLNRYVQGELVREPRSAGVTRWPSGRIAVLEAPTRGELAARTGRTGGWEFEDYGD